VEGAKMSIQGTEQKLAELIIYISQKCASDYYFGSVKLNKILFFSDFTAYGSWGKTISGAEYQHQPNGPVVHRMVPIIEALKGSNFLAIQPTNCGGYRQNRTVNLREPDLSVFEAREIALVDDWIERLRPLSASELSRMTHETSSWCATDDFEKIDPRTVFISCSKPDAAQIRRGLELADKHGLLV
jgi:Protein of unknown function (DUF4065)